MAALRESKAGHATRSSFWASNLPFGGNHHRKHQVESRTVHQAATYLSVIILCVAEATVASETKVMPNPSGLDEVDLGACKPADEFDSLPVTSLGGGSELRI
ncbi:hypothetical protein HJB56_32185 [Rhizobium lentis]|uniref:hypothetical protein n=1 Tax=Rhizobium lentis TaxID=1138194 RepID=UPI001C83E70F|nr:hypothetical protein [Rhizobium lentis]MBX5087346.1 hypothetical protein [Rhizobium lentis]MBX5100071.1 hypothetical protein [Rhizobium lentis]MBX5124739.1 hypothetical protein [Rhizobium lentis]